MKKRYQVLMAKTSPETEELWLPLWMHLKDTAGIMKKLVGKWITESVFRASGMDYEHFLAASVFLAAVHDIGKATSYFQSVITKSCPAEYEEIIGNGFIVNKEYREPGKTPHAYAGQWILQSNVDGIGINERMAAVVGAHHGKPDGGCSLFGEADLIKMYPVNFFGVEKDDNVKGVWKNAWMEIVNQALELAGIASVEEMPDLTLEAQVLISGLLIIADWIASNTTYFPLISIDDYGEEGVYPARVNNGWRKLSFPDSWNSEINFMDKEIFRERFGFLPNEVQEYMIKAVDSCENPGIFVLEAQMGIGKTEAALGAAEVLAARKKEGGIFFGLPTQATSNGLFQRLLEWGKQVSEELETTIGLAHGAAEFNERYNQLLMESRSYIENGESDQDGPGVHPWFQGNKKILLSDFVIGTVDQFLMAALRRRHFMLRHIGLAGKVIIIDECHAYDAYMNEYLERALQWMAAYGVPVILLSATLPAQRRKDLVECYAKAYSKFYLNKRKPEITFIKKEWEKNNAYPILTWTDGECINQEKITQIVPSKRVKISRIGSVTEMIALLDKRLEKGGCACIIANTVKSAQKIYDRCKESMKNVRILLYHAQFTMPDRIKKEEMFLKRMGKSSKDKDRKRLILIGTQVLEQSLDYDADIMVTQLCPIDLLLQRIGRLHRHIREDEKEGYSRPEDLQNPECIILGEDGENYDSGSSAVYGDYLLMRTARILSDEIRIPEEIPDLVQKVYDQENTLGLEGERYVKVLEQYRKDLQEKQERAGHYLMPEPKPKRRIGDLLCNPENSDEKLSEACVRDGESAIEVLLMKKNEGGSICCVEEDAPAAKGFSAQQVPESMAGRKIAMQRLRLPHVFHTLWNIEKTIKELEDLNRRELAEWQQSPWIHGELVLLLDKNNQAELNGYLLSYSYEKGLEYERMEDKDAGKGI